MNQKLIAALSLALCGTLALGLSACGGEKSEVHDDILNGGFEQGFTGWTKSGTAFSQGGVVDTDKAGPSGVTAGMAGKYFFSGYDSGNPQFTGTLQSDPFKLGGTGKIGFLMGGGMSGDKCYVEFFEQGNDTALAKVSNEAFALGYITDQLVRVVVDLSAHVGKTIYIKITDNDKGDADEYAYLNLDDFVVYKTADDVTKAEKERADKLAAIGKPAFSETETDTTIKNGGFEEGLVNWLMLDGSAFGARALCSDELFWANPDVGNTATNNRPYNKEGKNFLNTFFDESATGAIRSTKFTLAGDGIISFLMAGAKNKGSYVALCDGTTDEELVKVTFDKYFSDPNLSENMVRHYIDAKEYKGKVLYLKVVDGERSDFGGIIVDDFKVSMAEADVKAQMKADYLKAQEARSTEPVSVSLAEYNYYNNYTYPYALEVLRFAATAKDAACNISDEEVDLNEYLEDVVAVYGEETCDVTITKVVNGEKVFDSGFDAFVFSESGTYTVTYSATYGNETVEATFNIVVTAADNVANGDFEDGLAAGWTIVDGEGASVLDAKVFWEGDDNFKDQNGVTVQRYLQDGEKFLVTDEGKTVTIKSSTFRLGGDGIISFKFGVAKNPVSYVALCLASSDEELIKVTNDAYFNDPLLAQVLLRRFMYGTAYVGQDVYIKIVDGATSDFGFLNFDALKVGLTSVEAQAILDADKAWAETYRQDVLDSDAAMGARTKEIINAIRNYYAQLTLQDVSKVQITASIANQAARKGTVNVSTYLEEAEGILAGTDSSALLKKIVKVAKEGAADITTGFEALELEEGTYTVTYRISAPDDETNFAEGTFKLYVFDLNEGEILNGGFETGDLTGWEFHCDTEGVTGNAVTENTTFWNEKIPYNKGGRFFFEGTNDFIPEKETWYLKSSKFTLGGSGFITFKMGGRTAEVRVFKADGTQIATYANDQFADVNFPNVGQGSRLGTMTTFVADLSAYIGEELYLELHDTGTENWGVACFDDIVTYYETAPAAAEHSDTVKESNDGDEVQIAWVNAKNTYVAE